MYFSRLDHYKSMALPHFVAVNNKVYNPTSPYYNDTMTQNGHNATHLAYNHDTRGSFNDTTYANTGDNRYTDNADVIYANYGDVISQKGNEGLVEERCEEESLALLCEELECIVDNFMYTYKLDYPGGEQDSSSGVESGETGVTDQWGQYAAPQHSPPSDDDLLRQRGVVFRAPPPYKAPPTLAASLHSNQLKAPTIPHSTTAPHKREPITAKNQTLAESLPKQQSGKDTVNTQQREQPMRTQYHAIQQRSITPQPHMTSQMLNQDIVTSQKSLTPQPTSVSQNQVTHQRSKTPQPFMPPQHSGISHRSLTPQPSMSPEQWHEFQGQTNVKGQHHVSQTSQTPQLAEDIPRTVMGRKMSTDVPQIRAEIDTTNESQGSMKDSGKGQLGVNAGSVHRRDPSWASSTCSESDVRSGSAFSASSDTDHIQGCEKHGVMNPRLRELQGAMGIQGRGHHKKHVTFQNTELSGECTSCGTHNTHYNDSGILYYDDDDTVGVLRTAFTASTPVTEKSRDRRGERSPAARLVQAYRRRSVTAVCNDDNQSGYQGSESEDGESGSTETSGELSIVHSSSYRGIQHPHSTLLSQKDKYKSSKLDRTGSNPHQSQICDSDSGSSIPARLSARALTPSTLHSQRGSSPAPGSVTTSDVTHGDVARNVINAKRRGSDGQIYSRTTHTSDGSVNSRSNNHIGRSKLRNSQEISGDYSTEDTEPNTGSCPVDALPDSALIRIFSHLSSESLCRSAGVCRRWYALAYTPSLWTALRFRSAPSCGSTDVALKALTRRLSRDTPRVCVSVTCVDIRGDASQSFSARGLLTVARRCPELINLTVTECPHVSNGSLAELVSRCANLTTLTLNGCSNITGVYLTPEAAAARHHNSGASAWGVGASSGRALDVQRVDLSDCARVDDSGLQLLVACCPRLTHLYLRRCTGVTDLGLQYVAASCGALKEVSLCECPQVTDLALIALAKLGPSLRYLSAAKCTRLSDTGVIRLASRCRRLRYVNLRGCTALTDTGLSALASSCPRLRSVDVGKCAVSDVTLQTLATHCPQLHRLALKGCEGVTDAGLVEVAQSCRALQQLNIQDCDISVAGYRAVRALCKHCLIEHTNPGFY